MSGGHVKNIIIGSLLLVGGIAASAAGVKIFIGAILVGLVLIGIGMFSAGAEPPRQDETPVLRPAVTVDDPASRARAAQEQVGADRQSTYIMLGVIVVVGGVWLATRYL